MGTLAHWWRDGRVVWTATLLLMACTARAEVPPIVSCALAADRAAAVCDYRPPGTVTVGSVTAHVAGRERAVTLVPFRDQTDSGLAMLFLVDVSDPRRQAAIQKARAAAQSLFGDLREHDRVAVGSFADRLQILADFGSPRADAAAALGRLQAGGMATELYRNAQGAIALLKSQPGRRVLVILSDGKAEDTAYRVEDTVAAARAANVTIISLGYAQRVSDLPDLQGMRRLADETGGLFLAADTTSLDLPADFRDLTRATLENGGTATIALDGLHGSQELTLTFATGEGGSLTTSVGLPLADAPRVPAYQRPEYLAAAGLLLAGAGGLLIYMRRRRRRSLPPVPLAYLHLLDGDGTKRALTATALRLGRNPDNDLVLANDSVSGHHAEIHRTREGGFAITDLGAANGVYVNGEKADRRLLTNGDLIELGEVRMRFEINLTIGGERG